MVDGMKAVGVVDVIINALVILCYLFFLIISSVVSNFRIPRSNIVLTSNKPKPYV